MDIDVLIERDLSKPKEILVIGDSMIDRYVYGSTESCQDHCPKFRHRSTVDLPGGAWNAANQLSNWNSRVRLITNSIDKTCPVKVRFVDNGKILWRYDDDGSIKQCSPFEFGTPDAVLISDYDKGFLPSVAFITATCKSAGIPCVVDAKREPSMYRDAILKCNESYAERFFLGRHDQVVVTRGAKGPVSRDGIDQCYFEDRSIGKCVNHIGAGDSFAAHLVLALAHGFSLHKASELAHTAASVYVQHPHNRPPYPHEVRREIDPVLGKIVRKEHLRFIGGQNTVFTNGVFRIPHAGHALLMKWAREQGDSLIVGINSDESAQRIRQGFCLPFHERAALLAANQFVDWIVPFDEDDPTKTIEAISPDILVKGDDYKDTVVPGSELVKKTLFAPRTIMRSCTTITDEIRLCG